MQRRVIVFVLMILCSVAISAQVISYSGQPAFCSGKQAVLTLTPAQSQLVNWLRATDFLGIYNQFATGTTANANQQGFYLAEIAGNPILRSDTVFIQENNPLAVDFNFDLNNLCSNPYVPLTAIVTGGTAPLFYTWKFTDTDSSNVANPSFNFPANGCSGTTTFPVTLTVKDSDGCEESVTKDLIIQNRPQLDIRDLDVISPFSNCENNPTSASPDFPLTLVNQSPNPECFDQYNISWGDGTVQNNVSFPITHTYTALGAYTLVITGIGINGCVTVQEFVVGNQSNPAGGLATLGSTTNLCAPANVPFVITNWQNNSPGTRYELHYGDGTMDVFHHPLNGTNTDQTVFHTYTESSCPTPSYTATLYVINACDQTPYTAGNIQIRTRPTAGFEVVSSPTCVGASICFINTSMTGTINPNCSPATIYTWDFGDGTTSNNPNPCHVYNTPGVYTVTLTVDNGLSCGTPSQISREICVNPMPQADFTIDVVTGCAPVDVVVTNITDTSMMCSATTFEWQIQYTPTNCGSIANWEFTNGTNANTETASIRFTSPGSYDIILNATNSCGTHTKTERVVVKAPPVVSINPIVGNFCGNASINPSVNAINCGANPLSYVWSFVGGTPNASTSQNPGVINYSSPGTYNLQVTATNECGNASDTRNIIVNPIPDLDIPTDIAFCHGSTTGIFNFTSSLAGTSITWSNNNTSIGLPASGSGNINAFNVVNNTGITQTATITVSASTATCTTEKSFIITVYPFVPLPIANSPIYYCVGDAANPLVASALPGHSLQWYDVAVGGSSEINAPTPSTLIAGTFTYYVSQKSDDSECEGNRMPIVVNVIAVPSISDFEYQDASTCGGSDGWIRLKGLTPNTSYQVSYAKDGGAPISVQLTTNGAGIISINNLSPGVYDDIFVSVNNCVSNSIGPITIGIPETPQTPNITGDEILCQGLSIALFGTSPTPDVTYHWSGPNGFTSNLQNPLIQNAQPAHSGTYTLYSSKNNCQSDPVSIDITVFPSPQNISVSNSGPACVGSDINLTASTSSIGSLSYLWSGPNGFSSTAQNPVITNAQLSHNGNYSVVITLTENGQECSVSSAATNVAIYSVPVITDVEYLSPLSCGISSGSITLLGLEANRNYEVFYTFQGIVSSLNTTANGNGEIILSNLAAGTYSTIYVSIGLCNSNVVGPITLTNPIAPEKPTASSNAPICAGVSLQLFASSTTMGVTYSWTGPNGFTSTDQNPVINNASVANGGVYRVVAIVNNCSSPVEEINVVINPQPNAPHVSSPVNYCINALATPLTASPDFGATLNWYANAVGGSPLASPPVPSTSTAGTVSYYVSQTSSNGCESPRARIDVIVNPDAQALFTPTTTIGCVPFVLTPAIINLQEFPAKNSNYRWYANDVLIGTGNQFPGYTITDVNSSVTIRLVAESRFGCQEDIYEEEFKTYEVPTPSFTASIIEGCGPLDVLFTNTTPNASMYQFFWDFGTGQTSTLENPGTITFPPNPLFTDTTYLVTLTVRSVCNDITIQQPILVKSTPKALFTPDRTTACSPMNVVFSNNSLGNVTTYYWDFGDGTAPIITHSSEPQSHVYNVGETTTFTITLRAENECGIDITTQDIIVTPNTISLQYIVTAESNFGCAPHLVTLINQSSGANAYHWDFGDGNILTTTNGVQTITHVYNNPGNYTISLNAVNNCTDTIAYRQIEVYTKPTAQFSSNFNAVCIGQEIAFTNESDLATSFYWEFGDGNSSTLVNPSHFYDQAGSYQVRLIAFRNNASGAVCSDTISRQVTVGSQLPGDFSIQAESDRCFPTQITVTNRVPNMVTINWDFGDGTLAVGNSATHIYTTPGVYTIKSSAVSNGGCEYYSEKIFEVYGSTGSLEYSSGNNCGNETITFTALSNGVLSYEWDFGDGNTITSTTNRVTHQYQNAGSYLPKVVLVNAQGCRTLLEGVDTIHLEIIDAGFSFVETKICGATTIAFTDKSLSLFGLKTIEWDFGDGQSAIGNQVSHLYHQSGSYVITQKLTGLTGCVVTKEQTINVHVNNTPISSIQVPATVCAGDRVEFLASTTSNDPLILQRWELSNGVYHDGPVFNYQFYDPGNFTVTYTTRTINGCIETISRSITVNPKPNIQVSVDEYTICLGAAVRLQVSGFGNYVWSPTTQLSCSDCDTPVASPTVSTEYVVSSSNEFGCSSYDTVFVRVIPPLSISVINEFTICEGESVNLLASGAALYTWTPNESLSNPAISNPIAHPMQTTTYQVVGYDGYKCFTDTATVTVRVGKYPIVELGDDLTLPTGTNHPFKPQITNGPIVNWNWSPATDLSCSDCPNPILNVKKDNTYLVTVTNDYGCMGEDSVTIKTICGNAQVFIPNAFTPDGDGKNDVLMVRATGIATVKSFRIFNRWGEVVFERQNFPPNSIAYGWDGKVRGAISQPEVYVYTAEVVCENGTIFTYKGNVSLLK